MLASQHKTKILHFYFFCAVLSFKKKKNCAAVSVDFYVLTVCELILSGFVLQSKDMQLVSYVS